MEGLPGTVQGAGSRALVRIHITALGGGECLSGLVEDAHITTLDTRFLGGVSVSFTLMRGGHASRGADGHL